jgi:uncharacterized protein YkwD
MKPYVVVVVPAFVLALSGCSSLGVGPSAKSESAKSLNEFRVANGRTPLAIDSHLTGLAQSHASDMARRDSLDHNGFMTERGPQGARAENVAYGCKDEPCTIKMWINSSGHRTNMLRNDVTRYGLASAVSASGKQYWSLEVGQ